MSFEPASLTAALRARLAAFSFTQALAPEVLARLLEVAQAKHFPEDTLIVRPGEECTAVPLVERGNVRVIRLDEMELRLYDVGPGETCVLALSSVLRETRYPAQATATAGTDAVLVPADDMRALFARDPAAQRYVLDIFASRFTDLMDLAREVAFDPIESRLARLLLRESNNGARITSTHAEVAAMLGTAREVVSRALDRFQREGLVELGRRRIEVLDEAALRKLLA